VRSRSGVYSVLACAVVAISLSMAPAAHAVSIGAVPGDEAVIGTVVSSEARLEEDTNRVLTDVVVSHGTELDSVVMEGGEVGELGMWTELFVPVSVGQSVAFSVTETVEGLAADAPPVTFGIEPTESGQAINAALAGQGYDRGDNNTHWDVGDLPVEFRINTASAPAGALDAVVASTQTWEDDPGSDMDFAYRGTTGAAAEDLRDGINVIDWGLEDSSSGTLALCTITYRVPSYEIREFGIQFNRAYKWSTTGASGAFDVQSVGTHELGHTLHLADLYSPGDVSQTMFGSCAPGNIGPRSLDWGDRAGVAAIYPAASASVQPSVAPGFTLTGRFTRVTGKGTFTISGSDTLVGVSHVAYHVDGNPPVTVAGATATITIKPGQHTVTFWGFDIAGGKSAPQTVTVQVKTTPNLSLPKVTPSSPRRNKTLTMSGKIGSADMGRTNVSFVIQRRVGDSWRAYKTVRTTLVTGKKTFSAKTKLARRGTFRVRTTHAADAMHVSGVSKWRVFRVR